MAVTPAVGRKLVAQMLNQRMALGGLDAQSRSIHAIEVDGIMIEWLAPHAQPTPTGEPQPPPTHPFGG